MLKTMTFARITIDPAVCTGKPCIRHLRFPVARRLGLLAAGETREQILENYPYLEPQDIEEALRYAAFLAEDENSRRVGKGARRRAVPTVGEQKSDLRNQNRSTS